jgi:HlyD family secretion protein
MKHRIVYAITVTLLLASCGRKTNETSPIRKDITETVFATGTLEPEGKYNLTAQTEGYLRDLKVDQGDTIAEGNTVAVIDNPSSLYNAEAAEALYNIAGTNASENGPAISQARQNSVLLHEKMKQDSLQFMRYEKLYNSSSVSKLEYENARLALETSRTNWRNALEAVEMARQQARQQLLSQKAQRDVAGVSSQYNVLKAVKGGRVYKLLKEVGDYVRRGEVIAVIGHPGIMYAKLNIDEDNIRRIKTGQTAVIQLNTCKDSTFTGRITEIYPAFDEPTQSFICRASFEMPARLKIAGTQLQANVVIRENKNALVIPRVYIDFGNRVQLKDKRKVKIKTGFISGEWVEVLDSLDENSIIVTEQIK